MSYIFNRTLFFIVVMTLWLSARPTMGTETVSISAERNPVAADSEVTFTATAYSDNTTNTSSLTITLVVSGGTAVAPDTNVKTGASPLTIKVKADLGAGVDQIKANATTSGGGTAAQVAVGVIKVTRQASLTGAINISANSETSGYTLFNIVPAALAEHVEFSVGTGVQRSPEKGSNGTGLQSVKVTSISGTPVATTLDAKVTGTTCVSVPVNSIKITLTPDTISIPLW